MKKIIILSLLGLVPFAHAMDPNMWQFQEVKSAIEKSKTPSNSFLNYLPHELLRLILLYPAAQEIAENISLLEYNSGLYYNNLIDIMNLGLDPDFHLSEYRPITPTVYIVLHAAQHKEEPLAFLTYLLQKKQANPNQLIEVHYPQPHMRKIPILLYAIEQLKIEAAKLLVEAGAEVNTVDQNGYTMLDTIEPWKNQYVVLRDFGAKTSAELKAEQEQKK